MAAGQPEEVILDGGNPFDDYDVIDGDNNADGVPSLDGGVLDDEEQA